MNTEIQDTMQELQLAERSGDVGKMADLYGKLATMYFQAGETVTALGICQKNINMLEHTDNTAALAYAYLQKGELFDSHSTYSAEQCYKKALELFTKAGDKTGIGKTYYRLGENTDSHKAAVEYFKSGVDAYHEIKNGSGVVHCLTMQGANLLELNEYQEAEHVLETAVDIARQIEDNELLDDAIYYLARAKYYGEKYFCAQKLIEEAIETNSKIEDSDKLAYMKYTYGLILESQEKYQEAIVAFKECEAINRKDGDLKPVPAILRELGTIAFYTKDYRAALSYFTEEALMRSHYDNNKKLALAHAAYMCTLLNFTKDAVFFYKNRLDLFEDGTYTIDTPIDKAEALYDLANALLNNGEVLEAQETCRECIEQIKKVKDNKNDLDDDYLKKAESLLKDIQSHIPDQTESLPKVNVSDVYTTEFLSEVIKILISDKLGVDESEVVDDAHLTNDLGADSLDTVELIMLVEKEFGITLADDECEKVNTVGDAIRLVKSKF